MSGRLEVPEVPRPDGELRDHDDGRLVGHPEILGMGLGAYLGEWDLSGHGYVEVLGALVVGVEHVEHACRHRIPEVEQRFHQGTTCTAAAEEVHLRAVPGDPGPRRLGHDVHRVREGVPPYGHIDPVHTLDRLRVQYFRWLAYRLEPALTQKRYPVAVPRG